VREIERAREADREKKKTRGEIIDVFFKEYLKN